MDEITMEKFLTSVIIPVYNAERFLRNAVVSAAALDAVGEVILVEDASPDGALAVCEQLEREFDKVKLFRHPGGVNRGAGESRNLGISKSSCNYIAFLDADDWYLPNRFDREKELFADPSVDGVYGATGFFLQDKEVFDNTRLTTVKSFVPAQQLLKTLLTPSAGRFTTDAITIRKSLLAKTGLFDTSLRLHQDTHLWLRIAHFGKVIPGIIDRPVCIRRVHSNNRISSRNKTSRKLLYAKIFESFSTYDDVDRSVFRIIFKRFISSVSNSKFRQLLAAATLLASRPSLVRKLL